MGRYQVLVVALVVFAGIVAAAFLMNRPAVSLPDSEPYIRGAITKIDGRRVLVEEAPGEQRGNKCWFALTDQTRLLRSNSDRLSVADLTAGQQVRAWSRGPIKESYPCQTGAEAIAVD